MSDRTRVIVLTRGNYIETFGALTDACRLHGLKYAHLQKKEFPFKHRGVKFDKVDHKKPNGIEFDEPTD